MPMKGRFPIRRTLQYLSQGDVVFKDSVKVMTVNYNTHGELGEGARGGRCVCWGAFFCCPSRSYSLRWLWTMGSGRPGLDALHVTGEQLPVEGGPPLPPAPALGEVLQCRAVQESQKLPLGVFAFNSLADLLFVASLAFDLSTSAVPSFQVPVAGTAPG
ncbi:hypothetical protein FD755_010181 [Muntiacus reevesi]|uniref:Mitochondrial ribosomal protein S25 n=1 Tax=Muntiacus reevesi TaxID=9886 RepID=A0A5N3XXV7_MUNRE|nr:hypothetical protein FD755_010181 [Muntiacus reevesi]